MKNTVCKILAVLLSVAGAVMAIYVGGYWLFFRPVRGLILSVAAGTLTNKILIINIIKIFFAATAGGAVWILFDLMAGFFRDLPFGKDGSKMPPKQVKEDGNKNV